MMMMVTKIKKRKKKKKKKKKKKMMKKMMKMQVVILTTLKLLLQHHPQGLFHKYRQRVEGRNNYRQPVRDPINQWAHKSHPPVEGHNNLLQLEVVYSNNSHPLARDNNHHNHSSRHKLEADPLPHKSPV
jgi:hypothetical protein